jgi:hypothetical protein
MDPEDRRMTTPDEMFAVVPYSGKAPDEAIIKGNLSQVTEYIPQSVSREEAEQRLAEAEQRAAEVAMQQDEIRAHAAQILSDGLERLATRLDTFITRKQAFADQQKRDAEAAEIARVEAMLDILPDPDTPNTPDVETALRDSSHAPSGDLHSIAPMDKEPFDREGEGEPDPDDPENEDDPETRAEAVTGAMPPELDKGAPPEAGEYAPTSPPASPYRDPPSTGGP